MAGYNCEDTIAALSTPIGTGGIAVIRMCGPRAIETAERVFVSPYGKKLAKTASHKAVYGWIHDVSGETIDEVLVLVMRAPHTFTGEDTVEINCHGGMYICQRVLQALLSAGARMAEPGEFSKIAFLNGRMDLNEAEAIMDMISAQTSYSLRSAVQQRKGGLSQKIEELRQKLMDTIVAMEVNVDYPEYDDLPEITDEGVQQSCQQVRAEVEKLLSTAESGRLLRQGLKAAIVGKPNVGKSSLLNMLLKEQRAIVTSIPGTTRDVLEETLDLSGIPVRIMDTAGIRSTEDAVEKIGVERALASMEGSDLVLFVLDAKRGIDPEEWDLFRQVLRRPYLVLLNKMDEGQLTAQEAVKQLSRECEVEKAELESRTLEISAKEQRGSEAIGEKIRQLFFAGDILNSDQPMVTNMRQKQALIRAGEALDRVLQSQGFEQDLLLIDLWEACDHLGEVSGRSAQEDIVTEIFSRFCLGK